VNNKIPDFGEVGNYTAFGTYTLSKQIMLNLTFNSSIPFGSQKSSKAIITINQSGESKKSGKSGKSGKSEEIDKKYC